jgi:glycosyltransferase involved in cell wall biosynthesis
MIQSASLKPIAKIQGKGLNMRFVEDNPNGIRSAEIVVGIPSLNEADLISFPTQQADRGLTKYYPEKSAVIVNVDNHSPDDTHRSFMSTATETPKIYISTEDGVTGKGNNLRNLFQKALELEARAVLVIDADLQSIAPLWIRNLAEPLFDEYDFVAPLYIRHKYDVTVTNSIAYPLTRALYGRRVRQPIGGDVAFSGRVARSFVDCDIWNEAIAHFGIDVWMTTNAVRKHGSIIQSFMGRPKVHKLRDIDSQVGMLFEDVVGTMFELMVNFDSFWKDVRWSRPTAVFGFGLGDMEVPPPVTVDTHQLWEKFVTGARQKWELYSAVLETEDLNKLEEVMDIPAMGFEFPSGLWAKLIYDFAIAYRQSSIDRGELIRSMIPLHYGKTLSFVIETEAMNNQQVEEFIEDQCLQFEKTKPYLLERWG